MSVGSSDDALQLADWRRQVAEMYAQIRRNGDGNQAWCDFKSKRDQLFRFHSQTPLSEAQLTQFQHVQYFEYDPDYRVIGEVNTAVSPKTYELELPEGLFRFRYFADVNFVLQERPLLLQLYWVQGYGGGLFLPFRDLSNGKTTYGGGRYLYDAIKGADLSQNRDQILLDFNFAYNPSCAYNDQWVCPLAPQDNWLKIEIEAGEKVFGSAGY